MITIEFIAEKLLNKFPTHTFVIGKKTDSFQSIIIDSRKELKIFNKVYTMENLSWLNKVILAVSKELKEKPQNNVMASYKEQMIKDLEDLAIF